MFPKTLNKFYWSVIEKFPFYFVSVFLLGLMGYLVDAITFPYTSKWAVQIFETASDGQWSNRLVWIAGIYLAIFAVGFAKQYIETHWRPIVARYTSFVLYKRAYKNDVDFFINRPAGQITNQLGQVAGKLEALTLVFWRDVVKLSVGMLILIGGVLALKWQFAVLIVGVAGVRAGWRFVWQRKINRYVKQLQDVRAGIGGIRTDSLANAITVKMFSNVEYENKYIWNRQQEQIDLEHKIAFLRRVQERPALALWFVMCVAVLVMSAWFIMVGDMPMADGMFVFVASRTIARSFNDLITVLSQYSEDKASAVHAWTDIIKPFEVCDRENAKKLGKVKGQIDFSGVVFNYGKDDVIKNFDLSVGACEKVGIVGLSGAGKTTLVNLLLRAYDVKGGAIEIDGVDIRDVTQDSLHKNIAYVPQEAVLFNRTILDNIRYARPTATRKDVIEASKKAHIHDFISELADGYDTLVGNRGIKLSGGQRQRIAIARAILKNAPILILDEATSALDSKNELLIQQALAKVMQGKTTIAIAHRLSTLRNMDRIIVLNRGKIVECGTHHQLLRANGAYKKLWDMQTGGFVGE